METKQKNDFPLDKIDLNDKTYQARFDYNESKIENLAEDIKQYGQREPIGIRKSPKNNVKYQIIYGFQRVKACKKLDRDTIKSTVYKDVTDEECRELSVRDNEMHGDLSQIEKALQCHELKEEHGWSVEELCESFNTKKSAVYNWLKVAELDDKVQGLIHHGYLTVYHGKELVKVEDSRRLELALKHAVGWDFSVRDLRKWLSDRAGPEIMLGVNGWVSNCWRDLRWKTIEKCRECDYFEGIDEGQEDRLLRCSAIDEIKHPPKIEKFLVEVVGWGSETEEAAD